jgi:hypothetical protein
MNLIIKFLGKPGLPTTSVYMLGFYITIAYLLKAILSQLGLHV